MKSFTDIEQSKKLAKILPPESADMFWLVVGDIPRVHVLTDSISNYSNWENYPCWSLASLINVLPRYLKYSEGRCPLQLLTLDFENPHRKDHCWIVGYWDYDEEYEKYNFQIEVREEEVIDACYELIIKLKEQKLL